MAQSKILLIEPNNNKYDKAALDGPLGGSETVFLSLIQELTFREDIDLDIFFRNSGDFSEFISDKVYDLVISYRQPASLFQVRAKVNAVWLQDLPNELSISLLNILKQQGRIDKLIFLSHFQKLAYFSSLRGFQEGRHTLMLENPIDPELFDPSIKKEKAFIYASAPNRGLDVLLGIWPEIYKALPDWELRIAGSTKLYNVGDQEENKEREKLLAIGKELYVKAQEIQGIKLLGGLCHADLVREMEKASILLYPATWPETSCHVLNCALQAGAVPVTSQVGALVEKVTSGENGVVIPGDPTSDDFKKTYAEAVIDLIRSRRFERMIRLNRGMYKGWEIRRIVNYMLSELFDYEEIEGLNQRIFAAICSLNRNPKRNFSNLRWYAPIDVITDEIIGLPTDQARNAAAGITLEIGADWLLLLDDDIYVDSYFIPRILKRAQDNQATVVVAGYAYKDDNELVSTLRIVRRADNRAIDPYSLSEEELNGPDYRFVTGGAGALLIRHSALEAIGRPWFRVQNCLSGKLTGEDTYFFRMCRLTNQKIYVAHSEPVIHWDGKRFYGRKKDVELIESQIGGIKDD